ncbi:16S rRNA (guanine(527)-N(7))-methyltransferase RsmG [Plastoroseomonas hellenica]|uniref:16S rRNA (guanine(527)-N(7))-methyltransferase RsmG n=1 Tax=Plastoroseomonas hellenica TaxID=2687306 RepID=UPI003461CA27
MKQPDGAIRTRLDAFRDLLLTWNARINLIAPADVAQVEQRHIADSLQLLPLLPEAGPMGDLGSGGGLPALVLAAAEPDREWHLVESDRRKCAFLIEAARVMDLPAIRIHATRIEDAALPPLSGLTARALAPLAKLLPHAARLLAPGGIAIFPKGRNAEAELTEAIRDWTMTIERHPSRTDPTAAILRLSEIRRAAP